MVPEKLLKPEEVAELLGLSKQTLAAWRCAGRTSLRFLRVGRLIRYELAAVEQFIRENTVGQGASTEIRIGP